jgi:hypothetical protein
MGNRDHTTVLHGVRRIQEALKHDFILQRQVEQLKLLILAECSALPRAQSLEEAIEIIESESGPP